MKLKIFAFLLFSLLINESLAQDNLIRQTNNGLVRGRISNDVIVWLGIIFFSKIKNLLWTLLVAVFKLTYSFTPKLLWSKKISKKVQIFTLNRFN